MRKFQHGALSKQSRGSSMGQEVKAIVEHSFVAPHLQVVLVGGKRKVGRKERTFYLVHFI